MLQKTNNFWKGIISILRKKRTVLILVVFVVAIFLLKSTIFNGSKAQYTFDTVENGTVTQLVKVNGNVIAANATDVFSPTNGLLESIFVKNGDTVNKGDTLFIVKSTATPQEQAASFASYQTALNTLNIAQNAKLALDGTMWTKQQGYLNAQNSQKYKNNNSINPATSSTYTSLEKQSVDSGVVQAQKDFAAAEQAYKTAEVAIADGHAQSMSTLLAYQATQNSTVTAQVSGTINNLIGLTGARVEAQVTSVATPATVGTTVPVLIIGQTADKYIISTSVSEVYIDKITLGQSVEILFNGIANKKYTGRVVQFDSYGTNTKGIITYNVFVEMDTIDHNIKPNMSAILTINTAVSKNVLTAANAAIITHEGAKAVQIVTKKGNVDFIPVIVGLRGNTRSEILSGVDEGVKIIIGNTNFINKKGGSFSLGE